MGSFMVDDDRPSRKKRSRKQTEYVDSVSSGTDPTVFYVVLVMGALLLGMGFLMSGQPEPPTLICPNVTIPEAPTCPDIIVEKDEFVCNPTFTLDNITTSNSTGNYTNTTCVAYVNNLAQDVTIRFINISDLSDYVDVAMVWNASGVYNMTDKLNTTAVIEAIGPTWLIQTMVN